MAIPAYFDPRQQPVTFPLPTPEEICAAKAACFLERAQYIRHRASISPNEGLQAIRDLYGLEGIAAAVEYARMADKNGSASMARELAAFCGARGGQ